MIETNGKTNVIVNGTAATEPRILGHYIVADPKICHGKLTFRGTRIFVADVLEMVAEGMDWETIIYEWHGNITREAIAEAVRLATEALIRQVREYALEPVGVILLDENINASQRMQLRKWRITIRQIGVDLRPQGVQDEEIIPYLCQLRRPTFFTCDNHFFKRRLCHDRYCLVFLDVEKKQVAEYVRLLLRHSAFDTQARRMGNVIRASYSGLSYWQLHIEQEQRIGWMK